MFKLTNNDLVFYKDKDEPSVSVHVLSIPIDDDNNTYTLQREDNGDMFQVLAEPIHKSDTDFDIKSPLQGPSTHGAQAIIILPTANKNTVKNCKASVASSQ